MDNFHESCKTKFTFENKEIACECKCHGEVEQTSD
jgi:hypothetical protein